MTLTTTSYLTALSAEITTGVAALPACAASTRLFRFAIVAAGYPAEMTDFIDSNPGLKSRFTRTVSFPDYTEDELVNIFLQLGERNQYQLSDDALQRVRHFIAAEPRTRGSMTRLATDTFTDERLCLLRLGRIE